MIDVEKVSKEVWESMSANAHRTVFKEIMPPGFERLDFALIVSEKDEHGLASKMYGYATLRELDSKTLYMIYGGAFPGTHLTSLSLPAYLEMIFWCKKHYENVVTLIENKNVPMLKFAMKAGLRITGLRVHGGKIMLEHSWSGAV